MAVWSTGTAVVAALKLTEPVPAAAVTEPGTVNAVLLLVSATTIPPLGAVLLNATVHVAEAF